MNHGDIERIVQVREPMSKEFHHMFIASLREDCVWDDQGGQFTIADLFLLLRHTPRSLVVTDASAEFLAAMNTHYESDPLWQYGVSLLERDVYRPGKETVLRRVGVSVRFFGWKTPRKGGSDRKSLYHLVIDPTTFSGVPHTIDTARAERDTSVIPQLAKWGWQVVDFCERHGLQVKSSQGGVSVQFLRDPKFYPHPRRKVPRATNDRAREALPGNYYTAYDCDPEREFQAIYIDQSSAHHYHAAHIDFPHADHLVAYGRMHERARSVRSGDRARSWSKVLHGLFYGRLEFLKYRPDRWWHPKLADRYTDQYFWSTDLPMFEMMGVQVSTIVAAWGSEIRDYGLNRYAKWCLEQRATCHMEPWEKALLLATYGTLAVRPKPIKVGYRHAKSGEVTSLPAGRLTLPVTLKETKRALEPCTNNVIHRGLIEAATRAESVTMATNLSTHGFRVLMIFADAVIVEAGPPMPLLSPPWRVHKELSHFRIVASNGFISAEMERLPGLPRSARTRPGLGVYTGPHTPKDDNGLRNERQFRRPVPQR